MRIMVICFQKQYNAFDLRTGQQFHAQPLMILETNLHNYHNSVHKFE